MYFPPALHKMLVEKIEADLYATIYGPVGKQRQTALRLRGGAIETVELDDAGNIIEPVRCTCGSYVVVHHPNCPAWALIT